MAPLSPLVSTEWLGEQLHDDALRIVDCRFYLAEPKQGREEYLAGHIPTAIYLSLDDDLTGATGPGRHPLPTAGEFAADMARHGIGQGHIVVVYDDSGSSIAPRLWWMLQSLGHERAFVLDGGWSAWASEPRSITTEIPDWEPAQQPLSGDWSGVISREEIVADRSRLLLIDARAPERYRGEEELLDPVAGHIPGAFNVPYSENVDGSGRFLDKESLERRLAVAAGDGIVVSYCGSGVTACNNLLALAVAGRPNALLYPGSWSDWCTSGGEIATHLGSRRK